MKDCRSRFAWQCASRAERERNPSGYRASGLTPGGGFIARRKTMLE